MEEKYYFMDVIGNWIPNIEDFIDLKKHIISIDNIKYNIIHYIHIYRDESTRDDLVKIYLVTFKLNNKREEFLIKIEKQFNK